MTAPEQKALTSQWRIRPTNKKSERVRTRKFAPKVRSGCRTCKQRKLKCDEERPACARCLRAGYDCEYVTPKAWIFKSSEPSSSDASTPATTAAPPEPPAAPSCWGDKLDLNEQRALVYFKERTAPILSSFAHGSAQFWTKIIPQMALSNPTVRSAMIAASSIHENVNYRARSLQSTMIPEKLYSKHLSKSIGALTIRDQPPSRDVVLMTCLLFLACENLRQSSYARLHVQSGLKVLREWKSETSTPTSYTADSLQDVIQNTLEPIFARLEAQVSLTKEPSLSRAEFQTYDLNWDRPIVPDHFPDLFAARDTTHDIVQWYFYQTRRVGGPLLISNPSYHSVTLLFTQWKSTFLASFPNYSSRSSPAWSAATALLVHHTTLTLAIAAESISSTTLFEENLPSIIWLLDICEEIITSGPPPATDKSGAESLWLYDFCLNPPLLLTSVCCRDPGLRRKAMRLMRLQHCWNNNDALESCGSAMICETVIAVEESACAVSPVRADDVPLEARIRPLSVWFGTPGEVTLYYEKVREGKVRSKTVRWKYWEKPALDTLFMYPFGEMVKYGQFQGLIRPNRRCCLCRTYGASSKKDAWVVEG